VVPEGVGFESEGHACDSLTLRDGDKLVWDLPSDGKIY
jgi:hypothetical protein